VRLRRLNLEVSRLETDILRLKKHFATAGPSQDSLKTNDEPDETPQTAAAPPPETSNDAPGPTARTRRTHQQPRISAPNRGNPAHHVTTKSAGHTRSVSENMPKTQPSAQTAPAAAQPRW
jgi:hypothetical protein